jgi:small subunit ribosomal protein S18
MTAHYHGLRPDTGARVAQWGFARVAACAFSRLQHEDFTQVAKQRSRKPRRRDKKGVGGSGRRKPCLFCKDKIEQVDYKDTGSLRRFVSERGKIRSRRITGACRRHQGQVARAVKRARELALMPYVTDATGVPEGRGGRGRDRDRDRD